jgi:uncharacterized protein with GYD domain
MATYIILTRLLPEAAAELPSVAKAVASRIKTECPGVRWKDSYATLGEFDVLDIVEANDPAAVSKAAMIIRETGHGATETLAAVPWKEFVETFSGSRTRRARSRK